MEDRHCSDHCHRRIDNTAVPFRVLKQCDDLISGTGCFLNTHLGNLCIVHLIEGFCAIIRLGQAGIPIIRQAS